MPLTTLPTGAEHIDPSRVRRRCWKLVKLGHLDGWAALAIVIEHQILHQQQLRAESAARRAA